jgi:DNA invertase Pin-like site-specific DNA recombinase
LSTYNVSETVGYASLSQIAKAHGSDLEALSDFLTDIPDIVDIMGEDAEPGDDKRLLWDSVSDLIDKRLLKTLVVSCLYDIAGTDTQKLARFLAKLNENHVRLQVMKENLDTSRQTSRQIIEHAKLVFATAERLKLSPLKTDLI